MSAEDKHEKTEAEWRETLTPEQYRVLREGGTEPAFSGKYWDAKRVGVYRCAGCGQELYRSEHKFDSGSGWPSYDQPIDQGAVVTIEDRSHGMVRTELKCSNCDAHLGHLFPDGPESTGMRHCINSCSLDIETDE